MAKVLAEYPSKSNPRKSHKILLGSDGNTYCECLAWKMQRGKGPHGRRCKHLDDFWRVENRKAASARQLPKTAWERLTEDLFDDIDTAAAPEPEKPKKKARKGPRTVWDAIGGDD